MRKSIYIEKQHHSFFYNFIPLFYTDDEKQTNKAIRTDEMDRQHGMEGLTIPHFTTQYKPKSWYNKLHRGRAGQGRIFQTNSKQVKIWDEKSFQELQHVLFSISKLENFQTSDFCWGIVNWQNWA